MKTDRAAHWENVYATKQPHEVSWTQEVPATSLQAIRSFDLMPSACMIDIGGGESSLVDHLLGEGFRNLSVLDISGNALNRAKERLGDQSGTVEWIVSDINCFEPEGQYDLWHDRAVFHFLTSPEQQAAYVETAARAASNLVIATFSTNGPTRCSGLDIQQYSAESLAARFAPHFDLLGSHTEDHTTPFGTMQNFLFCRFRRTRG